ncbi:MAG: hypothetical protein AB1642_00095 [Pseudomonadota bacterium]
MDNLAIVKAEKINPRKNVVLTQVAKRNYPDSAGVRLYGATV